MNDYLIDDDAQREIATKIDEAVRDVISELPHHGSEEGITPVLGHALMRQSFKTSDLNVRFVYRQLSKYTEESNTGADGGFVVKVTNPDGTIEKGCLFQAKLLKGNMQVRDLRMSTDEAERMKAQSVNMLALTDEAIGIFYTEHQVYIVDAQQYASSKINQVRNPLAQSHRLVTLGTYLGKWMPRCTRGDKSENLISRIRHKEGFKQDLTMEVITSRPPIPYKEDIAASSWSSRR